RLARREGETVDRLLRLHFRDGRTRVNGDAQLLMAEMLNVFVREAAARAVRQAKAQELEQVDIEHLEKVLPQLVGGCGSAPGLGPRQGPPPRGRRGGGSDAEPPAGLPLQLLDF
uniref:Centromere protein X n=1 Tax=Falco tinnunculus TaxID=100819 RepID=A0A8C4XIX9_FALTI